MSKQYFDGGRQKIYGGSHKPKSRKLPSQDERDTKGKIDRSERIFLQNRS